MSDTDASPGDTGANLPTDAGTAPAANGDGSNGANGATGNQPGSVPYDRFKQVVDQRNGLQGQVGELLARVDKLLATKEAPKGPAPLPKIPEIPEGLDPIAKVAFVAQHAQRGDMDSFFPEWFEGKYGVKLDSVVEAARSATSMSTTVAEQAWERVCKDAQVDPSNQAFQEVVHGLVLGGKIPVREAVEKAKSFMRPPERPTATALDSGISSAMIAEDAFPANARQAHDLARQGKRVAHHTVEEIFARSK